MADITASKGGFSVRAHRGDAKTLLAFNLSKAKSENLAGFTIQVRPKGQAPYFLLNNLQFEKPADHAQDATLPANSSINAPIHKFRWLHVPGSANQGLKPFFGSYDYTVTPRYFDSSDHLLAIDPGRSVTVTVKVEPYKSGKLALGFTRGFTQSQAFVHHFGPKAKIRPSGGDFLFDTSKQSGVSPKGKPYTFAEQYEWLGFTAQDRIFAILEEVGRKKSLSLDVFAYDLNEPDFVKSLVKLAGEGRVRVILDNAALHHSASDPKPEDKVQTLVERAATGGAGIKRGKYARYAHDKVLIVYDGKIGSATRTATKVLTGSTNLSVTGLYVNSNHVLVFDDAKVADLYARKFANAWDKGITPTQFQKTDMDEKAFSFSGSVPRTEINMSPHTEADAKRLMDEIADRIGKESGKNGNVLFAVMQIDNGTSPVYTALNEIHKDDKVFSFGISDSPKGIKLYDPGKKTGVLVTGKPAKTVLPPPFDQVPGVGLGHQVHHKFVVCGFNRADAVVYCGSSNLAVGGEIANGDNLIAIRDKEVAAVFVIEALGLVDHFSFLDRLATKSGAARTTAARKKKPTSKSQAAVQAHWFLSTDDDWVRPYFDKKDLKFADRELFA